MSESTDTSAKLVYDSNVPGIYRPGGIYRFFDKPEHYEHTGMFLQPGDNPPVLLATGKVYKVRNYIVAIEVIVVEGDKTRTRWTHPMGLDLVNEK